MRKVEERSQPILEVKNLKKYFTSSKMFGLQKKTVKAVDDVSFTLHRGETLGLVGESGCGKSTLGRTILRLLEPDGGQVLFEGKDIAAMTQAQVHPYRKKMQLIFQDPYACLNPRLNVMELVRAPLDAYKLGTMDEREEKVALMLERVGLGRHQLYRYPHEFSGGQRQRIGIARALILEPEIVICDEPVSALDVSIRAQVLNLMKELQKEMNLSYLFISHDLSAVRHISDRIAVMYLGRMVEISNKADIYDHPAHPYTEGLLAAVPIPDPTVPARTQVLSGDLPSPYHAPSGCYFHPRCAECMEECKTHLPKLADIGGGHFVACAKYQQCK